MPLGGRLSVSSARRNGEITISIKDSGAGISDSARTQLFDPFFTTKPAGKGTGLGLSVCYGIVSAHDGRIEVESESGGTVFNVILPASTK